MLRIALLVVSLALPSTLWAQYVHGTVVVLEDGGDYVAIATDSLRLGPGPGEVSHSACKIVVLSDQFVFVAASRRVSRDGLTQAEIATGKPGERLLLSGKMLTGRDAAHKRICALLDAGKPLPEGLDFHGRVIYYVGPVDQVGTEVVGPAGPTTANRMDRFTDTMLDKAGLLAMVGKAERGPEAVATIAKHRSAYLI